MSNKEPWINIQYRPGNSVVKEWEEFFDDKAGHTGIATWLIYRDKNNKEHKILRFIRWHNV